MNSGMSMLYDLI